MIESAALKLIRNQPVLFQGGEAPLGLDEYQAFTASTDKSERPGIEGLGFMLLGLYGEVGSLLSELKKKQRDKDSYVAYRQAVIEELGDSLWYLASVCRLARLQLSTIAKRITAKLDDWDYAGKDSATTFRHLQAEKGEFAGPLSNDLVERRLLELGAKVGMLVEGYSSGRFDANRDALSAQLVEVFRAVLVASDDADVSLEEAALGNILKTRSRWPTQRDWGPLYDAEFDPEEQLPRRIEMVFKEKTVGGRQYVTQQCNGIFIGDQLTDNRVEKDDYRFHDVFHLAYAAILGWSPVQRALFKVKRKSNPEIDETQDGARAILIEEGLSTWIFNHGVQNYYFRSLESLDYPLLKAVQALVKGYEVETRPLWQWELAILEGFRVFRQLQEHRGGTVIADLIERSITFQPPP